MHPKIAFFLKKQMMPLAQIQPNTFLSLGFLKSFLHLLVLHFF